MKKSNLPGVLIAGLITATAFLGCKGNKTNQHQAIALQDTAKKDTVAQIPVLLKDTTEQKIYVSYISLKDALVKSDATAAKTAAAELTGYLEHKDLKKSVVPAKLISGSGDIKVQRKEFTALSNDLIGLFKGAALSQGKIYIQHCPMANNGDGGDWLSSEKKIQNPYYGDKMLECGAVIEELKVK